MYVQLWMMMLGLALWATSVSVVFSLLLHNPAPSLSFLSSLTPLYHIKRHSIIQPLHSTHHWTAEEECQLKLGIAQYGEGNITTVANALNRTEAQCRDHWKAIKDVHHPTNKGHWSEEVSTKIIQYN
jgi:hypothetical protein